MKCLRRIDLHMYIGQGLTQKKRERVTAHLAECSHCSERVDLERNRLALFQGRLREMAPQADSTLELQDLMDRESPVKRMSGAPGPWMRIAAGLIVFIALFSLIQHFLPQERRDTASSSSSSVVVNAFLDNDPAMAITISEGGSGETAPIFWLEKIKTRE